MKGSNLNAGGIASRAGADALYFTSLTVALIRGFGPVPQTLWLSPNNKWVQWTLILGNNGLGKSTLLQILATVSVGKNRYQEWMLSYDEPDFYDTNRITAKHDPPRFPFTKSELQTGNCKVGFPLKIVGITNGKVTEDLFSYGNSFGDMTHQEKCPSQNFNFNVFAYGPWRSPGQTTLNSRSHTREERVKHLFSSSAELIDGEEWLLSLDYRAEKDNGRRVSKSRERYKQVTTTLVDLLPDVSGIRIVIPNDVDAGPMVMFETPFGAVRLKELGYGYQSLIALVVDLAARLYNAYPDSPDPLAEPAICLVDEIDLHLHPSWQRKLMGYLSERFPRTQFIATAHSPLVVQAAEDVGANIVLLRREGDHVVIDNDPVSVKGWRVDQILASELFEETPPLGVEAAEMMKRQKALLKKPKLTAKEKDELKALNEKAESLPVGTSAKEIELNDRLRVAVELLEKAAKEKKK